MVGAGIIGLTSAVRLLEAGHAVTIVSADDPLETTSAVAAAVWFPYRAEPRERVLAWGERSLAVLAELAMVRGAGVVNRLGIYLARDPVDEPWWAEPCGGLRECPDDERRAAYPHSAAFEVPVIEMPVHLRWLTSRVGELGGRVERRTVGRLGEVPADIVVNATGLGSSQLLGDEELTPVRGQVVRVANPGLENVLLDEDHPEAPTYVVPRSRDCVLGGTAEEGTWDLEPSEEVAASILRRCVQIEPRLDGAEVLGHGVGLRPVRSGVRLEREERDGCCVVHNYGHGGAGVTLSWGCAEEVVRHVGEAVG